MLAYPEVTGAQLLLSSICTRADLINIGYFFDLSVFMFRNISVV